MGFLNRTKKNDAAEPEAAPSVASSGPGSALVRAASKSPAIVASTQDEERLIEQHLAQITQAWRVLRHDIDMAVDDYYRIGKFTRLEALVAEPIQSAMKAHLTDLRSQHVVWTQPKRRQNTEPHFEIIEERLPRAGRDEHFRFVIREDFRDRSLVQLWEGDRPIDDLTASGTPTAIEATVAVLKGNVFRLVALYRRDPKQLDD